MGRRVNAERNRQLDSRRLSSLLCLRHLLPFCWHPFRSSRHGRSGASKSDGIDGRRLSVVLIFNIAVLYKRAKLVRDRKTKTDAFVFQLLCRKKKQRTEKEEKFCHCQMQPTKYPRMPLYWFLLAISIVSHSGQ